MNELTNGTNAQYCAPGDIFTDAKRQHFYKVERIDEEMRVHFLWLSSDGQWNKGSYSPMKWEKFSEYIRLDCAIEEAYSQGESLINAQATDFVRPDSGAFSDDIGVISASDKDMLSQTEKRLADMERAAKLKEAKMMLAMERKKAEMQRAIHQMTLMKEHFYSELRKIRKVIQSIELYLGIDEEIVQIRQGDAAPADCPICFRQQMLYMDEETMILDGGGLDINSVDQFDEWLLQSDHLNQCLPEQKGMVVFRYRRNTKDYGDLDKNWMMDYWNRRTFLLIRNGENVYRIFTENINISPRLFPKREEFQALLETLREIKEGKKHFWKSDKDKAEDQRQKYIAQAMLMQGLIDRTDIFSPMPAHINMFDLSATPDAVRLIYDEEDGLPDGRLRFSEWKKEINSKIQEGSRIITAEKGYWHGNGAYVSAKDFSDRFTKYYSDYSCPALPASGIYTAEEKHEDEIARYGAGSFADGDGKVLTFLYNPKDEVSFGKNWEWEPHERKNRIRFIFSRDDRFVLNYDLISIEDIDFYLSCRLDRHNYLHMLPLLMQAKKLRIEEIEWEAAFVKMAASEACKEAGGKYEDAEKKAWEAVEWWKMKNKWKRPIRQDDEKALRMIKRKITNKNIK